MQFPILYKKAVNGKISEWSLFTDRDVVTTSHGYTDGIKQIDQITVTPKNIGRANETTISEQANLEAQAKWQKQKEKGYTEDPSGEAKMDVILPMLAQKYKDRAKYIKWPCMIQPKLNGMRCISYMKDGKRVYQSRLGKFWTTLEHLTEELECKKDLVLDGEIYLHGVDLQDIASLVKNQKDNVVNGLRASDLEYHVYDCINTEQFMWRIINASNGLDKLLNIRAVQTLEVYDLETANIVYKRFLELGYEGAILRNKQGLYSTNRRSNDLQKLKPTLDGEFKIVGGYRVDTGREEGTCVFTCITEEGKEFDVRPKGTVSRRQDYWKKLDSLKGKMLTCQFQEWTAEKKPFHARGVAIRDYE